MDYSPRHLHAIDSCLDPSGDDFARSQVDLFEDLIEAVGSADSLWRLDADPLPDEPFDWSSVHESDLPYVRDVLALTDDCCDRLLDGEYRTITRHILARVAARDPRPFRRRPHAARCAASLVWLALEANRYAGRYRRRTLSWLWAWFGVANCSDRGRSLCSAAGLDNDAEDFRRGGPLWMGDPALMHSEYRRLLVNERENLLEIARGRRTWSVSATDGKLAHVNVRAQTAKVVSAVKGVVPDSGRGTVVVGFGDRVDDAHYVALTIPDAHDLVRRVQLALDTPLPKI